ncbi:MAG: phosphodiester glycosidase family protein, partial [Patescibacteria group bacterium]|nr:phosphodiester glycosidase family protein [Patescibacteria group bacterium]
GSFLTTILKIGLREPNLKVLTLAAEPRTCPEGVCAAKPLKAFLEAGQGFAAINGSYFCSNDDCGGFNSYFSPLYESRWELMINRDKMSLPTTGPIAVIDNTNHWHYFKDVRDFVSPENFQAITGQNVSAALSNQPRILENGKNILDASKLTATQKIRSTRQALAYKDAPRHRNQGNLYLISLSNATLEDLAAVLEKLHFDNALNLDGGGSAALIYENEFLVGPGRDIPNAIVFKK